MRLARPLQSCDPTGHGGRAQYGPTRRGGRPLLGLLRLLWLLSALALAASLAVGCGGSSSNGSGSPKGPTSARAAHRSPQKLTVFAAASLTEPFDDALGPLASADPPLAPTYSFAGSGELVNQIASGSPADVIATADTTSMEALVRQGLVEPPVTFAHNKLEILVAHGNPHHVRGLRDLAQRDLIVVLCDTSVPAGRYARQILERAKIDVHPKSLEPNVKAAVTKVTTGEADAAIVYVTDVRAAGSHGTGVPIPDATNAIATYPIAVVRGTHHRAAAEAFVEYIAHGAGQAVLARRGFLPAAVTTGS